MQSLKEADPQVKNHAFAFFPWLPLFCPSLLVFFVHTLFVFFSHLLPPLMTWSSLLPVFYLPLSLPALDSSRYLWLYFPSYLQ